MKLSEDEQLFAYIPSFAFVAYSLSSLLLKWASCLMQFPIESLHLLHRFNTPTLQVIVDITTHIFHRGSCDIHLNHGDLLDAIWSWAGIKAEHRRKVAEVWL